MLRVDINVMPGLYTSLGIPTSIYGRKNKKIYFFNILPKIQKNSINDEEATSRINNFGKVGFVNHYRKRITEMESLKTTLRQLNFELDKKPEEQDKKLCYISYGLYKTN